MRIPKIRLQIETVEAPPRDESYGKEVLGCFCLFFCLFHVFHGGPLAAAGLHDTASSIPFVLGMSAALLFCAVFDKRIHGIFARLRHVYISTALSCGSMLALVAMSLWVPPAPLLLGSAALFLLGVSESFVVLYWGIAFSRMETDSAVRASFLGTVLAVGVFWTLHTFAPDVVMSLLCVAALLANVVLLRDRVTTRLPNIELREAVYFNELDIDRLACASRLAPMSFSFGIVLGILLASSNWGSAFLADPLGLLWPALACFASVALGMYVAYRMEFSDAHFHKYFRSLLPLVALLMMSLPHASEEPSSAALFSLAMALCLCVGLFWSFCACLSQRFRLSPVFTFGISVGFLAAGIATTHLLSRLVALVYGVVLPSWAVGLILTLLALVVLCAYFPNPIDITEIVRKSYDFDCIRRGGVEEASPGEAMPELPICREVSEDDPSGQRKGRFLRKCDAASAIFLLSGRESEVLVLLAKGRNAGFIKDALCISEGTAKTHVHHVYKKLGVHSQQELIALVDSLDVD